MFLAFLWLFLLLHVNQAFLWLNWFLNVHSIFVHVFFCEEPEEQQEQVSWERNFSLIFLAKNVEENSASFVPNKSDPIWMTWSNWVTWSSFKMVACCKRARNLYLLSMAYLRCKIKQRQLSTSSPRKRRFWQRDIFKNYHISQYFNPFQELRLNDREYHFRFVHLNIIHFYILGYVNYNLFKSFPFNVYKRTKANIWRWKK